MASYKDIARMTGLSLGTISNVIQGKETVKEKNREKVLNAMKTLGYRVNYQASGLASGKNKMFGLIVSDMNKIQESQILMPLERFAEKKQSRIMWATSRNDKEREKINCEKLLSSKIDVLFVYFQFVENEEYFRSLKEKESIPIIFLARYFEGAGYPYVAVDNFYAARKMVEYVYSRGHRKLTYIDVENWALLSPNLNRRLGVQNECKKLNIGYNLISITDKNSDDMELGYEIAEKLIKDRALPRLVFPRDDTMAVGFYNACIRHGVRVPEDVSIMGFGKFYCPRSTPKPLTTFDRKFDVVIEKAVVVYDKLKQYQETNVDLPDSEKKIFVRGKIVEGETILNIN